MKLSIIVPVYNVEKYLIRCLESIANQMTEDYELILVDDGSTDGSGALCDHFAQEHVELKIEVVHQANAGLSAARNRGMEIAQGEYITFVDSDDYVDPYTFEVNMEYMVLHPEVDMLEYPIEVHAESSEAYVLNFPNETQRTDIFADWIRRKGYKHCYACNKIYLAKLWNGLEFPVGEYFEDVAVMPHIVRRCHNIHYSNRGCYRYVMQEGSITTSYRYHKLRALFEGNHRLYLEIKDDASLQTEALQVWVGCLNQLIDMGRCADVDSKEYRRMMDEVDKHHPVYRVLLGAVPSIITRIKLFPLLWTRVQTYCRIYIALTKTLHP